MALTINTKSYNQDRIAPDAVAYAGPAHCFTKKDIVELKRIYPKPTATFRGVAKPSIKITRTVTLDDAKQADAILLISGSIPVGITTTDLQSMIADAVDLAQLEEAGTTKVFLSGDITY